MIKLIKLDAVIDSKPWKKLSEDKNLIKAKIKLQGEEMFAKTRWSGPKLSVKQVLKHGGKNTLPPNHWSGKLSRVNLQGSLRCKIDCLG